MLWNFRLLLLLCSSAPLKSKIITRWFYLLFLPFNCIHCLYRIFFILFKIKFSSLPFQVSAISSISHWMWAKVIQALHEHMNEGHFQQAGWMKLHLYLHTPYSWYIHTPKFLLINSVLLYIEQYCFTIAERYDWDPNFTSGRFFYTFLHILYDLCSFLWNKLSFLDNELDQGCQTYDPRTRNDKMTEMENLTLK